MTPDRRLATLLGASVLFAAVVGFFAGTRAPAVQAAVLPERTAPAQPEQPRYAAMGEQRRGPNASMYPADFGLLREDVQKLAPGKHDLRVAVADRAKNRAYDGAPPTIPHPVGQSAVPACLACHETGAVVQGKVARAMSHPREDNCLQCHAVQNDPRPAGARRTEALTQNGFEPLAAPSMASRAWTGAPPVMPHGTRMRDNCLSCHGAAGEPSLRTSHPERANCLQCHALDGAHR